MTTKLCNCKLKNYIQFDKLGDYTELIRILTDIPTVQEIPVAIPYDHFGAKERWFYCRECIQKWRLVDPDPPFLGVWEKLI